MVFLSLVSITPSTQGETSLWRSLMTQSALSNRIRKSLLAAGYQKKRSRLGSQQPAKRSLLIMVSSLGFLRGFVNSGVWYFCKCLDKFLCSISVRLFGYWSRSELFITITPSPNLSRSLHARDRPHLPTLNDWTMNWFTQITDSYFDTHPRFSH